MALRTLMKNKELKEVRSLLKAAQEKMAGFEQREADLETAIEEAETEEEKAAVQEEVEAFEAEKTETEEEIDGYEERIASLEKELEELEAAQRSAKVKPVKETPKMEVRTMNRRNVFRKMEMQQRTAIFEREDVKEFISTIRTAMKEKRAINNVGLLVPEVFLGLIRENIEDYSKLYKHVNTRQINGNGREVVMGTIPEAVWMECCANLNELSLDFADAEVGCWSVGGFFDVCNASLQDSDIDLASELITAMGQAIGLALDKAITYGLGTRMPLGIVARLAQTQAPSDYPTTARTWADLHTSNIKSIAANKTGTDLFKEIIKASGAAKGKYSRGTKVWVMNETTYTTLIAEAVAIDAAGAIVAGVNGTMPVIGGVIEVLDFVPDNVIIGGYFDLYLLAEREGITVDQSEHVHFLNNRTVFRGIARYDGQPVIAEAFVAIGIGGTTPDATMTFAADVANS